MWDFRVSLFHILLIIQTPLWSEVPLHFAGRSLSIAVWFTLLNELNNKLFLFLLPGVTDCCRLSVPEQHCITIQ